MGGQTGSTEELLAENQKHQRAAKSVCSVKHSSLKNAGFTSNDLHQTAWSPWQLTIRIHVNTPIDETNIKREATTRY